MNIQDEEDENIVVLALWSYSKELIKLNDCLSGSHGAAIEARMNENNEKIKRIHAMLARWK